MLLNVLFAFLSTFGFAVLFNIPRKYLLWASTTGATGWLVYLVTLNMNNSLLIASFFGGLAVGVTGEMLARILRQPATLFVVPGIIPLVPGYGIYYTMLKIIQKDYTQAVSVGFEALLIAIAIASAIIIASTLGRVMKEWLKV